MSNVFIFNVLAVLVFMNIAVQVRFALHNRHKIQVHLRTYCHGHSIPFRRPTHLGGLGGVAGEHTVVVWHRDRAWLTECACVLMLFVRVGIPVAVKDGRMLSLLYF